MEAGNTEFGLILDFLWLTLTIYAVRALFPYGWVLRLLLLLTGMMLMYYAAPRFLLFYILFWLGIWALQWPMHWAEHKFKGAIANTLTILCILIPLSPMAIWKLYPQWFNQAFSDAFSDLVWRFFPAVGPVDVLVDIIAPLGLSFTTFRALDLLIKVRIGTFSQLSFDKLFYFGFFPPVLAVGPIIEWNEIACDGALPRFVKPSDIGVGVSRLILGGIKIYGLAFLLTGSAIVFSLYNKLSIFEVWLGLFLFAWFFYFNFSGFSVVGQFEIYKT